MNTKTYIEKSKDKEILNHILLYIIEDTSSQRENEFARAIEKSTDGKITKEEFHNWIANFNTNKLNKKKEIKYVIYEVDVPVSWW